MIRESTADILRRRRGLKASQPTAGDMLTEEQINGVMSKEDRAALTAQYESAPIDPRNPERPQESQTEMIRDPELEQAAAEVTQPRPGSIPSQVGQSVAQAAPPMIDNRDAEEMAAAQEADRQSRNNQRIELAGRQFVAGVTQTPLSHGIGPAPSQVPQAQAAAKSRAERAAELLRRQRQEKLDASTLKVNDSQVEKNLREPAPKGGIDYTPIKEGELKLKQDTLAETIRRNRAREGAGAAGAKTKAAEAAKKEALATESQKIPYGSGIFTPRPGVKIPETVLNRSVESAGNYAAASAGIDDLSGALSQFAAKPGAASKDAVVASVRGVSAALNVAYKQGAMAESEARAMQTALGADVISTAGLEALVGTAFGDTPEQVAATITRRAAAVKKQLDSMAMASMKAANYEYQPREAKPPAAPAPDQKAVKYLVSPDKTRRVPVYADGSKGPEEAYSVR